MKTPFASFRLSRGGIKASGVLIVENAEADRLTRMGYCTYQDRSTHAMGNLNAYTLSVCLRNYPNSPEFPDSSYFNHQNIFGSSKYRSATVLTDKYSKGRPVRPFFIYAATES